MNSSGVRCGAGCRRRGLFWSVLHHVPLSRQNGFRCGVRALRFRADHRDDQHAVFEHGILSPQRLRPEGSSAETAARRCRDAGIPGPVSSFWRPRTTSWLSSWLSSRSAWANPATAIEIRNRSLPSASMATLDIVGRVTVRGSAEPVDPLLIGIEAQQKRGRKQRDAGHHVRPFSKQRRPSARVSVAPADAPDMGHGAGCFKPLADSRRWLKPWAS